MNSRPSQTAPGESAHPLHAMTTYELRNYRRDLEHSLSVLPATARSATFSRGNSQQP